MTERPRRGRLREQVEPNVREPQDPAPDLATRDRLLQAALHLFTSDGFRHVTVRDIARAANANVASVNYHFGDKMQLYLSVVQSAIDAAHDTIDGILRDAEAQGRHAEDRLRYYLRASLLRAAVHDDRRSQMQKLFGHEIIEPTPATEIILEKIVRPRLRWLARVVAEIMESDPADARVKRCVNSIQAQFLFLANPTRHLWFDRPRTAADLEGDIDHLIEFSLAGIRAIAAAEARGRGRNR
jgi:AcrR family transcriptional regulator